jgi:methylated-DNA-[protein]-cysteine S-methyltransferase
MTIEIATTSSPVGPIVVAVREGRVCAMQVGRDEAFVRARLERRFGTVEIQRAADPAGMVSRLQRYFAGELAALDAIAVDPGGTPFQQRVWRALRTIPPGSTTSYGALARAIGAPTAVRAVGAANGANPIWLVLPCHRVIGADGSLTGYGGGLDRKRWLLEHEGVRSPSDNSRFRYRSRRSG